MRRRIMGRRNDHDEMEYEQSSWVTNTIRDQDFDTRTSFIGNISTTSTSDISVSSDKMTMKRDKSSLSPYLTTTDSRTRQNSHRNLILLSLAAVLFLVMGTVGGDIVYIRSGDFGQLVTSSTARWSKGIAKDPLHLKRPNGENGVVCRVFHTTLRGVGLVSDEREGSICNIATQEGEQGSDKYQTISISASRLVWSLWKRPNPPPTGAVAVSVKPQKFLAADLNYTSVGVLDPTLNLGSAIFPHQPTPSGSCFVLTEIEPVRYELSDIQLKRNKGFIEEDIVLAVGKLFYADPSDSDSGRDFDWDSRNKVYHQADTPEGNDRRGKVESILSYETNSYDYWGQGNLMAKGLHTTIHLADGSTKISEWGIPLTQAGKTETMTAVADLFPGTAINVTLHGTRLNGEMSYWASLKTFFKDGTFSTRLMDNHRKVIEIHDIRLEHSRPYFLSNGSIVPEPTTTTVMTSTTSTTPLPYDDDDFLDGGTEGGNALPVESSPHNNIQADQSLLHLTGGGRAKSAATSVALSQFTSAFLLLGFSLHLSNIFARFIHLV